MSPAESHQIVDILDQVREWPPESRRILVHRILETLATEAPLASPRSVQDWIGMGAGPGVPPDDETVRRWMEEHRAEKFG